MSTLQSRYTTATAGSAPIVVVLANPSMLVLKATKLTASSVIPSASKATKASSLIARRSALKTGETMVCIAKSLRTCRTKGTQKRTYVRNRPAKSARKLDSITLRNATLDGTARCLATARKTVRTGWTTSGSPATRTSTCETLCRRYAAKTRRRLDSLASLNARPASSATVPAAGILARWVRWSAALLACTHRSTAPRGSCR